MRFHFLFIVLITTLLTVVSCGKTETSKDETIINCQLFTEPKTLHPLVGQLSASGQTVLAYTSETLTGYDPETAKQSDRVAFLPEVSEDFRQFTYTIKEAAAWDDGSPIMGADVTFSFKFFTNPLSSTPAFIQVFTTRITNVEVSGDDPRKVIVTYKDKSIQNPFFMNDLPLLDKRFFDPEGILDKYRAEQIIQEDPAIAADSALAAWGEKITGEDYGLNPEFLKGVSGPYQIVEWEQRNYIKLSKKPNYWGKGQKGSFYAQGPSQIIFRPIREPAAIELQLKQGAIDVATFMRANTWKKLSKDEGLTKEVDLLSGLKTSALMLGFNCRPEGADRSIALKDWRVRRAVAHLFSAESYNQENYAGKGILVHSPVPVFSEDYNTELQPRVTSRDSAIYWLELAGWKDTDGDLKREKVINGKKVPLKSVISFIKGTSGEDLSAVIIAEAQAVGFEIQGEALSPSALSQKYRGASRGFDMLIVGAQTGLSPYEFYQQWTTPALMQGSNYLGYTNPKLDSLSNLSSSTIDPEKRRPWMKQMQEIWYQDQPAVFIINLVNFAATHKRYKKKELSMVAPYLWVNTLGVKEEN